MTIDRNPLQGPGVQRVEQFAALQPATAAERMRRYRARQRGDDIPLRKPGPRPARAKTLIIAHPGGDRAYALDFHTPVRHVATEMEKSGTRGASIEEMAAAYRHSIPGELSRIRSAHGLRSDAAARLFLIDRAVSALGRQVRLARGAGRYRLACDFDDLRYDGKSLTRRDEST